MEKQHLCVSTFVLFVVLCFIPVDSKYLITTSRVYNTGSVHDVNVHLYNIQNPWNITASLTITRGGKAIFTATKVFEDESPGVLKIKVPRSVPVRYGKFNNVHLVVEGYEVGKSKQERFKQKQPLTLMKQRISVFIQTDKPIYKPGQTIRMRIVCLTPDLKPSNGQVQRVSIANPSGVRMMQWDNLDLHNGIASLEMSLSKYPVLGKWKIAATRKGKETIKVIEVSKYVLPKFEVIIRPPPFIAIDSKEISGTICARYTYGQLVKGKLKVTFRLKQSWWWSSRRNERKIHVEKNITGCYDFTLTNKDIDLAGMKYSYYGAVLNITAAMTEEATGISLSATSTKTKIVPYRVRLNFRVGTPKHFKPGLPFYGQLHVTSPDQQPIRNETVTITADDDTRRFLFKKEFLIKNGIVNFVFPKVPTRAKYLSINARHGSGKIFGSDYGISNWYSTAGIHCRPWFSKSWSFLALRKLHTPLKVGEKAQIDFQYTFKGDAFKSDFVYQLMCRGKSAATGRKTVSFQTKAATTEATQTTGSTTEPTTGSTTKLTTVSSRVPSNHSTNATASTTTTTTSTPTTPVKPSTRSSATDLKKANGTIEFLVTQNMVPSCRMLVYYVREDGETVADSMLVDIEDKLENQVQVRFSESVRRPSEPVQITLSAAPGSTVALSAVDKSVRILREVDNLDSDEIFDILSAQDVGPTSRYGRKKQCGPRHPFWRPLIRRTRSIMPRSRDEYVDASKAFYDTGLVYFSDLKIESRPCPKYNFLWRSRENGPVDGPMPVPLLQINAGAGGGGSGFGGSNIRRKQPKKKAVIAPPTVRKNFPETWLWTEEVVSNLTGQTVITAKVPDTITSWYASAFAMSTSNGIGVTDPSILTVFKPFFVSFTLPYSVIRGEQVSIITTVFNYMSQCSTILVSLTRTEHFELSSNGDQRICICGNEAKSVKYVITPLQLGHISLKVTIKNVLPSLCQEPSNEARLGISDAVVRKLLVEPEGVRQEYTYSSFVCPKDSSVVSDKIKVHLPKNLVTGSVHATISTIGDLMGPSLTGLEGLLRLPTGCGEQNMVKFAPNIFIMQYLNSTGQLAGDLQDKAVGFLRTGYQRELTYKRKDGSYSAFGNRDDEGSLWLTAFVLRSFSQARQFIFVDEDEIKSTTKWIASKQLDNGCFRKHGRLFNKALKGGVSTPVTLTAYVAISLLESNVDPSNPVIRNALQCIIAQKDTVTDSYSNAIIAFALTLAKHPSRREFLGRLRSKAIFNDGLMHWGKPVKPVKQTEYFWLPPYHRAPSTNIEMTSYALMAMVGDGRDDTAIADALPIVRWITKQRNALGGFSSTQDTCLALQALSRYAEFSFSGSVNMRVDVGYTNDPKFHQTFRIDNINRLVLQRAEIPPEILPMTIPVDAFGNGCALVQADVVYHIRDVEEKPAFRLSVSVRRRPIETSALVMTEVGDELCQPLEMFICATWLGEDKSGMAVLETKLVSGFTADEETLERLMNRFDLGLMKYELEENKVILYFDEITDVCVSFGIVQSSVVKKTKPSSVTVYEYYDTDKSATVMYNITDELCLPETEISPPETTPAVPQANCPICPKETDFDISKIQGVVCKTNNVMAVRTVKDGTTRFEFISTAAEFIGKKLEKKPVRPIEIILPKACGCPALSPRSKALVLLQEKKIKKKLKKIVLNKTAVVLHRNKASTIRLSTALLNCP